MLYALTEVVFVKETQKSQAVGDSTLTKRLFLTSCPSYAKVCRGLLPRLENVFRVVEALCCPFQPKHDKKQEDHPKVDYHLNQMTMRLVGSRL